jgi:flavin reductase (DIM6/NTAB) family NADH-FMN oxidoreductase RutF
VDLFDKASWSFSRPAPACGFPDRLLHDLGSAADVDVRTFWQAIECRAVGATVVTTRDASGPAGFLALSATHLQPPLRASWFRFSALVTICRASHFAVNYFGVDHENMTKVFTGRTDLQGADRFTKDAWTTLSTGASVLADVVGVLDLHARRDHRPRCRYRNRAPSCQ